MNTIAIVIAEKEGGLNAAIEGSGYTIIVGTERKFTSLDTLTDVYAKDFGVIRTGQPGWIALAESP